MIRVGEFGWNSEVKLRWCSSTPSTSAQASVLSLSPFDELNRAALGELQILTLPAAMVGL